jgi:hypothetical protein
MVQPLLQVQPCLEVLLKYFGVVFIIYKLAIASCFFKGLSCFKKTT